MISLLERGKQEGTSMDIPQSLFLAFFYAPPMMLGKQHHTADAVLDQELAPKAFEFAWEASTI
jgi:hypothetical protein